MNDSRRRRTAAARLPRGHPEPCSPPAAGERRSGSSTETTSALKGAPVKVMVWTPEEDTQGSAQPGVRLTAQAYEKWINANGGIKGAR